MAVPVRIWIQKFLLSSVAVKSLSLSLVCCMWYVVYMNDLGESLTVVCYCLLYYCKTLPVSYLADQRMLLFWKKILKHENVLRTLANSNKCAVNLILSEYALNNINMSTTSINNRMWNHFVDCSIESGKVFVC